MSALQSRPTAVMYGAGNIGRGFIGQLFSLSGYETQFIDINMTLIDRLNADGRYPHYTTAGDHYDRTYIEHVSGIDGKDPEAIATAIAKASVMATAIGVNVLPYIAKPIAGGMIRRMESNGGPLNIIVCENKLEANEYLRGLVYEHLSEEQRAWANEQIGFVEASIGRMVPAVPAELAAENPLSVCVEPFCQLPVDRAAFRGEIPAIVNLQPFTPFEFFIERKLFLHNMTHAMTAYLGALQGDKFVWESALRPEIKLLTLLAAQESCMALSTEHGVPISELLSAAVELLYRFENRLLGDTLARVGKDTQRKLGAADRLVGAYRLCQKHGISCEAIALGIAAGLYFVGEDDPSSEQVAACAKEQGVAAALAQYAGMTDPQDVARVERYYALLGTASLMEVVQAVELQSTAR